jgi:serine/threonine-protein kinase
MGEVYRARDPRLNRDVAIKVLARAGADPARQRRLLDAAQAASALNHPNIITVYDGAPDHRTPSVVQSSSRGIAARMLVRRSPFVRCIN